MPPKIKVSKEDIMKAAFELTRESGIEAVTAKSLARRLDCSTQPVYWVFENMENLRQAVIYEANRAYNSYLLAEVIGLPKYKATGWNYIRFAREEPNLFKLLFMTDRNKDTAISDSNLDENKEYIISLIKRDYGLDSIEANEVYVSMWLFSHGIATMLVTRTVRLIDEEIGRMLTTAFSGIMSSLKNSKGDLHD